MDIRQPVYESVGIPLSLSHSQSLNLSLMYILYTEGVWGVCSLPILARRGRGNYTKGACSLSILARRGVATTLRPRVRHTSSQEGGVATTQRASVRYPSSQEGAWQLHVGRMFAIHPHKNGGGGVATKQRAHVPILTRGGRGNYTEGACSHPHKRGAWQLRRGQVFAIHPRKKRRGNYTEGACSLCILARRGRGNYTEGACSVSIVTRRGRGNFP
jgi:hypothetical protein